MWFLFGGNLGCRGPADKMNGARHILSYAQTLRGGGVERALLRLAGAWAREGRRVTLVIGDAGGPLRTEVPDTVEVVGLGTSRYTALRAVAARAADLRPDMIFCPGSHYTSIAAWTKWRLGKGCPPIVGKVSNALERPDYGPVMTVAHRAWLRQHPAFLDRVVVMSEASAEAAIRVMRLPRQRIAVIPNPPAPRLLDAPLPPLPPRYILGVGRLAPQKRWDRLVEIMPRLAQRIPLVILGEGECRAALRAQADALGVELLLPGHVADPLGAMAGAAVLALTSEFEGVPGVLGEALSMGTPVVTTDCAPAVREIVAAPSLGSIVARGDAAALATALDHWLGSPVRPQPVPLPGADSAARYLRLFDDLIAA
ncbi:glycosyltransferase [Sphingomonas sp. OV641]|uniref:glycosyltransferase n=1 Tax=Sphingomonas sp. OV641 TaxID=1881068 RepID=UPI00210B9B4F|nr:glycosyltransferase [Sphingomonas sp. OV641]